MQSFYADLHIHSMFSDGENDPRDIVLTSINKGLNVISITDHNTFEGSIRAKMVVLDRKLPIFVIYGNEVRTSHGDVLIYCDEPIEFSEKFITDVVRSAKQNGCIVVPAHPFDLFRKGIGNSGLKLVLDKIDAIECYNAYSLSFFNNKATKFALSNKLPCLASSDSHTLKSIGAYKTEIKASKLESCSDLYNLMKQSHTKPLTGSIDIGIFFDKLRWSIKRRLLV